MSINKFIKRLIGKGRFLTFNETCRDAWVVRQAAQIPAGSLVIDVGAGSCPYRKLFAHCDYRSHDFVRLEPGQLRGHKNYAEVNYVSDICNLPVADNTFDVVLCTEVLEHVPEPIRAVLEISRVLKPNGKILLTAPLGSGLHQEPYHFYGGYTPHWYRRFLVEAGFAEVMIEPNRGFFSHYGQEGLRFVQLLAPWKCWGNVQWVLVWLLGLPWCLLVALLSGALDRLDVHKGFTVGYHVTAIKCMPSGAPA